MSMTPNTNFYDPITADSVNQWYDSSFADAFSQHDPLMKKFMDSGVVEGNEDGGAYVLFPVALDENTTFDAMTGPTARVPLEVQNPGTNAQFPWTAYSGNITLTKYQKNRIRGNAKKIDVVQAAMEQGQRTAVHRICQHLYSTTDAVASGVGAKIGGLGFALSTAATQTVGGISQSANSGWAHTVISGGGGGTYNRLLTAFNDGLQQASFGPDTPDVYVTDRALWNGLWEELTSGGAYTTAGTFYGLQRLNDTNVGKPGFSEIIINGTTPVIWSRYFVTSAAVNPFGIVASGYDTSADDGAALGLSLANVKLLCANGTPFKFDLNPLPGEIAEYPGLAQSWQYYGELSLGWPQLRCHVRITALGVD